MPADDLALLSAHAGARPIRLLASTASTNDALAAWLADGAPDGALVVARRQTEGRGRAGRRWFADPDGALAMSLLVRDPRPLSRLSAAPIVVGVAIRRAIVALAPSLDARLRLKWPNDLLADDGRKLGGVLIEARTQGAGAVLIVGIGINVRTPRTGWPALDRCPVALDELGASIGRGRLALAIAAAIEHAFDQWRCDGLAALRRAWWAAHGGRRPVRVRLPDGALDGEAIALDDDGALVVAAGGRLRRITVGDVEGMG